MSRKYKFKDILLGTIVILSALSLLLGLLFNYIYMPTLSSFIDGFSINGFQTLGFADQIMLGEGNWGILLGVVSYIVLISALFSFCLAVYNLIISERSNNTIFVNIIASFLFMVVGIAVTLGLNNIIAEEMRVYKSSLGDSLGGELTSVILDEIGNCATASFWPFVFQIILCIAYVVCDKFIREPIQEINNEVKVENSQLAREKQVSNSYNSYVISTHFNQEKETEITQLLRQYKEIYAQGVISVIEFEKKKYSLMFDNASINVEDEKKIPEILIKYRKVYDEGIITIDEYEKKKVQLLNIK